MTPEITPIKGLDVLREQVAAPKRSFTVTLIVMTLNEIDGVKAIMPKVRPEWVDQIIIVDGNSTDGTIEWARDHGYEVYVQQKPGFRSAYQEVWPRIKGDVVIYFTPDGNSIPEVIPQLVLKMEEGYDLVVASRYLDGARSEDDDLVTRFGNWMFGTLSNLLLRSKEDRRVTDLLVMFRAHRKDLPQRLHLDQPEPFVGLERIFRARVDWIPLMSMRAMKYGIRWCEIPADEPARIGGKRKLKVFQWGAVYLLQLLREAFSSNGLPVSQGGKKCC